MCLVIVDMQPMFPAAQCNGLVDAVKREVLRAISENRPVIVLEYVGWGPSYDCIMELLEGYDRWVRRVKRTWSGAAEVLDECQSHGWDSSNHRVCGVETFACVAQTCEDLAAADRKVVVVTDGCNDSVTAWLDFPEHENITLEFPTAAAA